MPKRRHIFIIVACAVVIAAFMVLLSRREPSYQGRSLSSWVGIRGTEANYTQPYEKEQAMRHMGTNAIPYLFRWIEEEPSSMQRFREKAGLLADKFGITMPPRRTFGPSLLASALSLIGPDAELAIPRLSSLMQTSTSEVVVERAATCLAWLGDKGVTPFLAVITNPTAKFRPECIFIAIQFRTNAAPLLIPALIQCLEDQDRSVAEAAVRTLGDLRLDAQEVVPALSKHLQQVKPPWSGQTARALGNFGQGAEGAVPVLQQALTSGSKDDRKYAREALRKIAPDALTDAPPK